MSQRDMFVPPSHPAVGMPGVKVTPFIETPDDAAVRLKCDAPRVSQADLEANIVHTEIVTHVTKGGQILRWCVLTTKSGFAVAGDPSASVDPANDRAELGCKYARENAIKKLWPLMAYELKQRLAVAPPAPLVPHFTFAQLQLMTNREVHDFGYTYDAAGMEYIHKSGRRVGSWT